MTFELTFVVTYRIKEGIAAITALSTLFRHNDESTSSANQIERRVQCIAARPSCQNELTCVNSACNLQGASASNGQGDLTRKRILQSQIS